MNSKNVSFYSRARRSDGASTRSTILNAAGQLFAEFGYAGTTNRAICERAGSNTAAINYYFGGKDGLYEAVLIEAHSQIVDYEKLAAIRDSGLSAEEKFSRLLRMIVRTARVSSTQWGVAVLLREMLYAPAIPPVLWDVILPKLSIVRGLVHDVTGFPEGSAAGNEAVAFMVFSCLGLIISPTSVKDALLLDMENSPERFEEDVIAYVVGGLKALRARHSGVE